MWTLHRIQEEIQRCYGPSISISIDGGQYRLTHGNGKTVRFVVPEEADTLLPDAFAAAVLAPLVASLGITQNPSLGRQSRPRRLRPRLPTLSAPGSRFPIVNYSPNVP